jgi:hypothetical protein
MVLSFIVMLFCKDKVSMVAKNQTIRNNVGKNIIYPYQPIVIKLIIALSLCYFKLRANWWMSD